MVRAKLWSGAGFVVAMGALVASGQLVDCQTNCKSLAAHSNCGNATNCQCKAFDPAQCFDKYKVDSGFSSLECGDPSTTDETDIYKCSTGCTEVCNNPAASSREMKPPMNFTTSCTLVTSVGLEKCGIPP